MSLIHTPTDLTFGKKNNLIPATACTVTGSPRSAILAVQVITQQFSDPVDLWMLHCNPRLQRWLESQSGIRQVFISPIRDTTNYYARCDADAIPVYGPYEVVVHLGDLMSKTRV